MSGCTGVGEKSVGEKAFAGLTTAALSVALCAGAAMAQDNSDPRDARSLILGPLLDEMSAAPGPAFSDAPQFVFSDASALSGFAGQTDVGGDVGALRFARAGLAATLNETERDSFSVFNADRAVIATSPNGGQLSLSLYDANDPNRTTSILSPDYAQSLGRDLRGERDRPRNLAVRYQTGMDSPGGSRGLDVGLTPRAGLGMGEAGPAVEAGATLRIGRYLRDETGSRPAWWFFAGADRQALLYNPGQGLNMRSAVAFEPYAMVGDAQAGVAMRMGPADLSVAYVRRETTYSLPHQSWDTNEDFAAFSLTMRR